MPRKTWPAFWGLTPQLFLFLVLPLTALLMVITLGGAAMHQQAMRALVGERDVRSVRAAASAVSDALNHRQIALKTLALAAASMDESAADQEFGALLAQSNYLVHLFDAGLAIVDSEGRILSETRGDDLWQALAADPAFAEILIQSDRGEIAILSDPETRNTLIVAAFTTEDGRAALGALSPANLFEPVLSEIVQPELGGTAFVIVPGGRVLFLTGNPTGDEDMASHPGVDEALQGESGANYLPAGKGEHVVAYSHVPVVDWALIIEEPWTAVVSPELTITENAPLVLVPVVLFAMVALWFTTHRIVQPLKDLEARAARLAWGNFAAIEEPVGGIQEIHNLQRELIHMAHQLRAAQQGLRDYIGAMTHGQEEERRRLARELHDDTLQSLIALKQRVQLAELAGMDEMQSGTTAVQIEKPQGQAYSLKAIEDLADETIRNLRRVTRALRPIYLEDLGLAPALEMLVKEVERTQNIPLQFSRRGKEKRFPPETELALYRIAQEALSNIVRHAQASEAGMEIIFGEAETLLQIWDDGVGFSAPESPAWFTPEGHYGLLGLYERAEMIGAQLSIVSEPGQGATIRVALPVGG